ncbi:hypothetical protein AB1Y20_013697 [Prymnesium parvum]|uniref:ABC transporter domain-containing protein n=1 Tax=Prymnesium parvum TaxID=97485 RepID=A0AB34IFU4_PRYPA
MGTALAFLSTIAVASASPWLLLPPIVTAAPTTNRTGASLEWRNLTFVSGSKEILKDAGGSASAGRILAIMGPSGSGKTTLLNALAGQLKAGKKASITGTLLIDGQAAGGASSVPSLQQAYVRQEDIFYTQMTVRETLMFAAQMKLPRSMPLDEKRDLVDSLISKLSLVTAAETIVGDSKTRGISGGERKRLSIGCELLSNPSLLFLDEPTSGLDSYQAQQVVAALKRLADEGCTIIMSIHQPRGSIFNMFDDLLLLSEGRTVYHGKASEVSSYLKRFGYVCPSGINPGEFAVDLVSKSYLSESSMKEADARILKFAAYANEQLPELKPPSHASFAVGPEAAARRKSFPSSAFTQFKLLFRRSWREVARSRAALGIKVVQQVMISFIYGGIYSLDNSQRSIQDRFGLLSLIAIGAGNLALASTVRTFPKEKAIVVTERAKNMYGMVPYFASKAFAEAPVIAALSALGGVCVYPLVGLQRSWGKFAKFLGTLCLEGFASGGLGLLIGAAAPSTDTAFAMFPPILVLMIIFNGFNVAEGSTPKALRWIPQVSFIRWCTEGLAVNEFSGLKFTCDEGFRGPYTETGEAALARVSMDRSSVRRTAIAQTSIIAGCYGATLHVLRQNKPRFLSITPPRPIAACSANSR